MIIGITGLISSGKDTAADYLIRFHGFKKLKMLLPMCIFEYDFSLPRRCIQTIRKQILADLEYVICYKTYQSKCKYLFERKKYRIYL